MPESDGEGLRVHVNTAAMTWGDLEDLAEMRQPRAIRECLERFVTVEGKSLRDLRLSQMRKIMDQIVATVMAERDEKN